MIVGDSISAGPGCYKKYLVQNLMADSITSYEFVGEYTDDCGGGVRHSAVSCTTTSNYTMPTFMVPNCTMTTYPGMATLVETHNPDLVMLQLGVNDVWGGSAPIQPILNNYATLVTQARAHNPRIVVMVAQIHKIITDNCMNMASTSKAEELVMAIPAWAQGISTADSPVLVADLWTNSDAREANDCVHPNDAGAQRMGTNWFNALAPILRR
jgi:lysophospholipase L1-like esterase